MTYTRPTSTDPGTGGGPTDATVIVAALSTGLEAVEAALPGKETAGAAATAVAGHVAASDPHGDRAVAASALSGHVIASDPHGDRAAAAGALAAHEADTTAVHGIADTSALVLTGDARLSDARTPTAHAASHAAAGSDPVTLSPSQVTGTAVVTADARLSDARTPTAHSHAGTDVASGTVDIARLPTGTGATQVALGNHTHAGGGYATMQDEGSALTARTVLNFTGPGVTATDNAGSTRTDAEIRGTFGKVSSTNAMIAPTHMPGTSNWTTTGQIRYGRVYLDAVTYKGLCVRIKSVGSGSTVRAAVYTESTVGNPQNKVAGTEVSLSVVSAINATMLFSANWTPTPGFYWLAVAIDGGTAQLESINVVYPNTAFAVNGFPTTEASAVQDFLWSTGAFPASAYGGAASTLPSTIPGIGIVKA